MGEQVAQMGEQGNEFREDFLRIKFSLHVIPISGRLLAVERFSEKDKGRKALVDGTLVGGTLGGGTLRLRDVPRAVAGAVRADFAAWVERNFFNPRAGRIGDVSYTRAGELDDAVPESGPRAGRREARRLWFSEAYDRALVDHVEPLRAEEADFLLHHPHVALQLMLGVTDLRGLRCLRRGLTQEVNRLQARACRARRYARDNDRRRALAAERRRIARRTTLNPRPTPEALRAAFAARGASPEAKVRLGGLLEDLECHVDNCLRFGPDGEILGRNGGVKAWLREHAPELFDRYKTLMRYKALARRLRQAAGIADPVPASAVFDGPPAPPPGRGDASGAGGGDVPAGRAERGRGDARDARDYYAVESQLAAARRLMEGCGNTCAALFRAVDAALDEVEASQIWTSRVDRPPSTLSNREGPL